MSTISGRGASVLVLLCWIIAGCTRSLDLAVVSTVPPPVVTRLPLTVGVHFDHDFREHVHTENAEGREDWRIDTRQARLALFRTVLPAMFEKVIELSGTTAPANAAIEGILAPHPIDLQLAVPEETYSGFYEAWVQYRIGLHDPSGALITQWDVVGYGRDPGTGSAGSRGEHLNAAIDNAHRDLGARLVLGFPKRAEIRTWLCSHSRLPPGARPGAGFETASGSLKC